MIENDNCYHAGVEMRCEIENDEELNVSLLSFKQLYI